MISAEQLLEQPVAGAGFSNNFTLLCGKMGFEKIGDIAALTPEQLLHRDGFTFHWLSELITFLEENQALHLLQARPPKENTAG
ncbi:hypothetical protein GWR56_13805 [Mucilaginibacter sp. 14171R-50]|uniref:hypothetical protein n=1 Tax=Mucilaginibacter sp. 14171R-50 TaxID=2703789 RepID=UPI00138B64F2|nr:hypothetical protein [Mucilaginibacter sp. 14171R-50]QHS56564.1 hypothetical protein GWR56_13805 [Mucilaginibacter sp. 14171R-50]